MCEEKLDSLWGFKVKDVIYIEGIEHNERFVVTGFLKDQGLHIQFEGEEYFHSTFTRYSPDNIILLNRPIYKFKVGDRVRRADGWVGIVRVLDPESLDQRPYLVEFKGWTTGLHLYAFWKKPWYPREHKTLSISRQWYCKDELELITPEVVERLRVELVWAENAERQCEATQEKIRRIRKEARILGIYSD